MVHKRVSHVTVGHIVSQFRQRKKECDVPSVLIQGHKQSQVHGSVDEANTIDCKNKYKYYFFFRY